ncbi:hypothetical protein NW759_013880 [Fusarium solani]|nr:hypothetical protein NW759_013880 [Fusarium solani]
MIGLVPFKFEQLPLGSIKASGWLKDQIELSAEGLGGHLFDFYRYVQRSTWLGGDFEYSELHESAPYWFNYIVPMASELCMAVESMFSYAFLYRFHGSNLFADRAELAAFNALPAAMSPDWWSHQYVTQTNQPWSRNLTANPFFNVVSYSNSFGLEPNFPCCTVNHPQGYPKYVASSFVKYGENGLVHMLLGPSIVETKVKNRPIQVKCRTNYPFSDRLDYEILAAVDFDFYVRIPQWVDETTALSQFAGQKPQSISAENGLYRMSIRKGFHRLSIHLPMTTTIAYRNNTVGVYRGPLLYAADIKYSSSSHRPLNWTDRQPLPTSEVDARSLDWVLEPTSNWRYAIDPTTIKLGRTIPYDTKLPSPLFDRHNFLPSLEVNAYPLNWPETLGTAALPPEEVEVKKSEVTKLKLIPFGAAKLHIAQFPIVK